jgi:hypothetical protein
VCYVSGIIGKGSVYWIIELLSHRVRKPHSAESIAGNSRE